MASCAIPGIFPCINYEEHLLVDGGISINVPINILRNYVSDIVVASVITGNLKKVYNFENSFQIISKAHKITKNLLLIKYIIDADYVININLEEY